MWFETELQIFPLLLSVPLTLSLFPGYDLSSRTGSLMFDCGFSVKALSMLRTQTSSGGLGWGGRGHKVRPCQLLISS